MIITKKNIVKVSIALIIPVISIYLSSNHEIWINFWNLFFIPSQLPPYSDLDAINKALLSKEMGLNPYIENPQDTKQVKFLYPSIWISIFDILNLKNITNFKIFSFLLTFFYCYALIDIVTKFNNNKFKFIVLIFFFSTSSLLLIERLNIEISIFFLLYYSIISKNIISKNFFYILSFVLKLFPLFSIFIFVEKKFNFFFIIFFIFFYYLFFNDEISYIRSNMIEYSLIITYGIPSIAKGFYYYSTDIGIVMNTDLGFIINDSNYFYFKILLIILASLYSLCLFIFGYKKNQTKKNIDLNLSEKLFLGGAGIYLGTFLLSANWDYRLIFLIFTIPYILSLKSSYFKYFYCLSFLLCINSVYFEGGNRYTVNYFLIAFIIYSFKIYIFSYLSYLFGFVLKNYIFIKINR